MVYTSDLRAKHILRDLHEEILNELRNINLDNNVFLRIFDDPQEDDKLWNNGGLTFIDPDTQKTLGSNDAGWYVSNSNSLEPLVIVEATFGTERGQFGDGQFNRFSHPLAVAKIGYIGVMLIPFKGESYSKSDGIVGKNTSFASMKYAYLSKTIVKAALGVSTREKGEYLIIDFYDLFSLKKLVIEKVKQKFGFENNLKQTIDEIKKKMINYASNGIEPRSKIESLYHSSGKKIINSFGYIFTQNFEALTTSSKRDGHGLLGKILSLPYFWPNENMYAIFLRLDDSVIQKLKKRNGKEVSYIFNNPKMNVISRDQLEFSDKNLEKELIKIEGINLFQNRQSKIIKEIRDQLRTGKIKIKN